MLAYHLGLDQPDGPRGKRMRPLLGLLVYRALTGDHAAALPGAAAVELGHNFSLVHDDIEDSDAERRHRPTLWAIWGVPLAINAGDALFALSRLALYRALDAGTVSDRRMLELMRVYDETCLALCEGQFLDISFERRTDVTVDEYMEMIGRKTAALLAASLQAGAILADDTPETAEAFRNFGYHIGLAFQMADDVKGSFWTIGRIRQAGGRRHPQAQEDPAAGVGAAARAGARCLAPARDLRRRGHRADDAAGGGRGAGHPGAQRRPRRGAGSRTPLSRYSARRPRGAADQLGAPW